MRAAARNQFTVGRGLRRQPRALHAVVAVRLSHAGPQRHRRRRVRRRRRPARRTSTANAFDARVDLDGRTRTRSVFATRHPVDRLTPWTLTLSGRYNRTDDRQQRRDHAGRRARLARRRSRVQPLQPGARRSRSRRRARSSAYAGYNEGSRAPIVDRARLRRSREPVQAAQRDGRRPAARPGRDARPSRPACAATHGGRLTWNAGVFRAEQPRRHPVRRRSTQTASATSRTSARRGGRASSSASTAAWATFSVGASYTWLDATYRSAETVNGGANSTNDAPGAGLRGRHRHAAGRSDPADRRAHLLKAYRDLGRRPRSCRSTSTSLCVSGRLRARQREQRARARRHLLPRRRRDRRLRGRQPRRRLRPQRAHQGVRAGRQPVRRAVRHGVAARARPASPHAAPSSRGRFRRP